MRRFCGVLWLSVAVTLCLPFIVLATELKVNADRVVLRAAPGENSEIVTQVSDGDILVTEKDLSGEWVEVAPPSRVNFWVYGELVREGVVDASKIQVRVGPGINYRMVGELAKNEKLTVRGEYREWLKIAPPPVCRVWINRKYVDPVDKAVPIRKEPPEDVKAPSGKKAVDDVKKPAVPVKPSARKVAVNIPEESVQTVVKNDPAIPPSPGVSAGRLVAVSPELLIKDKLVTSKEQGRTMQYDGVVKRSGLLVWRQPSRYRLVVRQENGETGTACYLMGDETQISSLAGKQVGVRGREYWIQGVRLPVIITEQIIPKSK